MDLELIIRQSVVLEVKEEEIDFSFNFVFEVGHEFEGIL